MNQLRWINFSPTHRYKVILIMDLLQPDRKLSLFSPIKPKIKIWKLDTLSEFTINSGLASWLINKNN